MARGGPPHPYAVKKGDNGGRPAAQMSEGLAFAVFDRLRTSNSSRGQMLHQRQKERHVAGCHALFGKSQDVIGVAGMQQEVGIFDAFGDAFV